MNKHQRFLEGDKRAKKLIKLYEAFGWVKDEEFYDEWLKHLRSTRVPCSCMMCGSARKHFGEVTLQEIKAELDEIDGINDIYS